MSNETENKQENINFTFIAVGVMAIALCGFMGMFSAFCWLGVPAGLLMIWTAIPFRNKRELCKEAVPVENDDFR